MQLQFSSAFHPQIGRQMELVNWTLGNMLHFVCGDNQWNWEIIFPQLGFDYNSIMNWSTRKASIKFIYTFSPHHIYDLDVMSIVARVSKVADNVANKALQCTHLEVVKAK